MFSPENAVPWKIARLTSNNDGQGRDRNIARAEYNQSGEYAKHRVASCVQFIIQEVSR